MNVRVFEQLHEKVQQELSNHYAEREVLKCYNIKRFDSTMISVLSHLLKGMEVGNTKNHKTVKNKIKVTTELTNDFKVSFALHKDQAHLSEETALRELIESTSHSKKDVIVFD